MSLERPLGANIETEEVQVVREAEPFYESVYDLYKDKLTEGRVSALIKVVLSDPNTRTRFYQLFEDRKILETSGVDMDDISQKATPLVVSLMRDEGLRSLFIEAALEDMRDRSGELKEAVVEASQKFEAGEVDESVERALVYNRGVIGAGVHAAIFNNRITQEDLESKNLTTDKGDRISGNFSTKSFVSINSKNLPHTGEVPKMVAKKGNQNYFGKNAPVQLPYIEPERFPTANVIAEVATANQYLSNSEVLFNNPVARIVLPEEDPNSSSWPAKYKEVFADGTFVFVDEVILTTGLGEIEYPKQFDAETMKVVKRDSLVSPEGLPPGVMTYEEFAEFVTNSPTPLRYFADKIVDLAGGGDGAATVLEELLRLGKRKSYKLDVAQTGVPAMIHWVGQKIKDSEQYKAVLTNDRYLMLAQEMPLSEKESGRYQESVLKDIDRRINPKDGHLTQIRDSDDPTKGRYRVTYTHTEDGSTEESYTDFVVLAAGYKNVIGKLLGKDHNPFDRDDESEVVKGEINGVEVPISVKLKGHDIYTAGPASLGQVMRTAEMAMASKPGEAVNENLASSVAIAVHGPRTEALAEMLASKPHRKLKKFEVDEEPLPIALASGEAKQFEILSEDSALIGDPLLDDVQIKIGVGKLFESCHVLSEGIDQVSIIVEKNPANPKGALISFSPNITNADRLIKGFISERLTADLVHAVSRSRWKTVIEVPFSPKGGAKIPDINLKREKA